MTDPFEVALEELQPSQLYISRTKLAAVLAQYAKDGVLCAEDLPPIPVKRMAGRVMLTDGHTRAFAACRCGLRVVRVHWDRDELEGRVVDPEAHQRLWLDRCREMHRALNVQRVGRGAEREEG